MRQICSVKENKKTSDTYSKDTLAKADPYIVMVSTPDKPGGLFYNIENEPEETCLYKRLKMDWTVGLHKIYSEEEIEKVKHSPSFRQRIWIAIPWKGGQCL